MALIPEDINIPELMSEYITLKEQMRELEHRTKQISNLILMLLDPDEAKSLWHEGYTFTSCQRRSWDYPAEVKAIEKQLKAAKKKAEEDGTATASYSVYLRLVADSEFSNDNA